jgi:hypothetical protein
MGCGEELPPASTFNSNSPTRRSNHTLALRTALDFWRPRLLSGILGGPRGRVQRIAVDSKSRAGCLDNNRGNMGNYNNSKGMGSRSNIAQAAQREWHRRQRIALRLPSLIPKGLRDMLSPDIPTSNSTYDIY